MHTYTFSSFFPLCIAQQKTFLSLFSSASFSILQMQKTENNQKQIAQELK